MNASRPPPGIVASLLPMLALVALLFFNIRVLGGEQSHVPLILATVFAGLQAILFHRLTWKELEDGILHAIQSAMTPMLILVAIGVVIATWMQSGVVPLLISYGLHLISPSVFLLTACLVCCVVSLATGSSWTTAGTVGVALIGAGQTLGLDPAMVAGAVVSGAYFGDKMSPLSDTTNLAPAMAGSTLAEHIRHMVWTVTPALTLALIGYAILGALREPAADSLGQVAEVTAVLDGAYRLSPLLLLPPALTLVLVMRRFPPVPALLFGALTAVAIGLVLRRPEGFLAELGKYFNAMLYGYKATTGNATVDGLLSRGGIEKMMNTVALVMCALSFGGVMLASGMLQSITAGLLRLVRGAGSLIATTILTCFGVNAMTADQYMAIMLPGRMFKTAFLQRRLHPKNLSRALEDSGTVTSPLIFWNTCGAQMYGVLGVSATLYWKYAFLNLAVPLVSILYGFTGWTIRRISDEDAEARLRAA